MGTLYISIAGCGKTTKMVKKTIEDKRKSLVLTLSNNDFKEIYHKYHKYNKVVPKNITIDHFNNIKKYDMKNYDVLYIDEFQEIDDTSYINDIFDKIDINLYFDPRQRTIKSKPIYKDIIFESFMDYINHIRFKYGFEVIKLNECQRMNQGICDLVKRIFNDEIISVQKTKCNHQGVFYIKENEVEDYIKNYNPYVLNASKDEYNNTKGLTVDHILIYPTKDLYNFVNGNENYDKISVYIALTRAKYSVGIVI